MTCRLSEVPWPETWIAGFDSWVTTLRARPDQAVDRLVHGELVAGDDARASRRRCRRRAPGPGGARRAPCATGPPAARPGCRWSRSPARRAGAPPGRAAVTTVSSGTSISPRLRRCRSCGSASGRRGPPRGRRRRRPRRTCCIRWMCEAKVVTITRPGCGGEDCRRSSVPTVRSGGRCTPGTSAFVESASSTWTPSVAEAGEGAARSVRPSSIGVWSNLKSPVWTTVPTGRAQRDGDAVGHRVGQVDELGAEGPDLRRTPGSISTMSAASVRRCSSSLLRSIPSMKRVP